MAQRKSPRIRHVLLILENNGWEVNNRMRFEGRAGRHIYLINPLMQHPKAFQISHVPNCR